MKVIIFPIAAQYLLLISSHSWCSRDLKGKCWELYTACILSQYYLDKAFHFPGKFHFLVKTITGTVRLGVVYLNIVLSRGNRVLFCEIYLSTVCGPQWHHHDPRFIYLFHFNFFNRSSILDPRFPINLEVMLITLYFFSTTEVINCSKVINAFKR